MLYRHFGFWRFTFGDVCRSASLIARAAALMSLGCVFVLTASAQSPSADQFDALLGPSYSPVARIVVQPDGKIIIVGTFTTVNGQDRSFIARTDPDGTLDADFNPQADGPINLAVMQANGKVLVGGRFNTLNAQPRSGLGRLNRNGTLDTTFTAAFAGYPNSMLLQADGKLLVAGFDHAAIVRLDAGGSIDRTFTLANTNYTSLIALQTDGKVLVGGWMSGAQVNWGFYIARLNSDGSVDKSFHPAAANYGCVAALQADGKILAGGPFTSLAGQKRIYIGRLNADGTLDQAFDPLAQASYHLADAYEPVIEYFTLQADGKILVGGAFDFFARNLARLNPDGSVDPAYDPQISETYPTVNSMVLQADGKLLVAGRFSRLGGQSRTNLARVNNTGPALQSLSLEGSKLIWLRGGTSPEVWRTSFACSFDNRAWKYLGAGKRVPGGWELSNVVLPKNTIFRARGFTQEGFIETIFRPPLAISDIQRTADGGMSFKALGPAGEAVSVETSTDMQNWTPIQTNVLGPNPLPFSGYSRNSRSQFYRLRVND